MNGRRRFQAYVTLEGVSSDVLFDSVALQNRAVRYKGSRKASTPTALKRQR